MVILVFHCTFTEDQDTKGSKSSVYLGIDTVIV